MTDRAWRRLRPHPGMARRHCWLRLRFHIWESRISASGFTPYRVCKHCDALRVRCR